MVERVQREAWEHTSAILCIVANVNRDPKKHGPFRPRDFNPFYAGQRSGIPVTPKNIAVLKAFVRGRRGQ